MPGMVSGGGGGGGGEHGQQPPADGGSRSLSLEEYQEWKDTRDAARSAGEAQRAQDRSEAIAAGTSQPTGREMFELCPEVFDVDERGQRREGGGAPPSTAAEVVTGVAGLGDALRVLPAQQGGALFLADDDPSTGKSWCPDCVMAGPVARSVAAGTALVVCMVGDKPTWKDPGHPLRNDPELRLGGVPFLVEWSAEGGGGRWGRRWDLESCPDEAAVRAMVEEFVAGGGAPA